MAKSMGNINYLLRQIKAYLDGKVTRVVFELDFPNEFEERYSDMESEDEDIAELFYSDVMERIFNRDYTKMSDEDFDDALFYAYDDIRDAKRNGLF